VPNSWPQAFFLTNHPTLNEFWSPLIAAVISMLSLGGVISFICADLIIVPIHLSKVVRRPDVALPARRGHAHSSAMLGVEMESKPKPAIDPVCGMSVEMDTAEYRSFQKGETYYFCSAGRKEAFDKDPGKYIARPETGPAA
jgi:YHS domain-containing protein